MMYAGKHYSKLNYHLFFKLGYAENEFPFGDDDSKLKLSTLYKFCSKDFGSKKSRNNHVWTYSKNLKEDKNRERKNKKRRKGQDEAISKE